jgi:predicted nuclease with RNAse H fold
MSWTVIGVDCATQEERTGLAHGVLHDDGALELRRVTLGTAGESAPATIAGWIAGQERFVIALDAPLGWPAGMASGLGKHRAGEPLGLDAEEMFRRETDRYVRAELGKLPHEVGADRIARTAHAALGFLAAVRAQADRPVPLAWTSGESSGVIEVFPPATLLSRGIKARGYKGDSSGARNTRARIWKRLQGELRNQLSEELLTEDEDMLDAAVCALAAADFARGHALAPADRERAEREGWIWFRGSGQRALF